MTRKLVLGVMLVLLIALAGCGGKAPNHEVHFSGPVTYENSTFTMNGTVIVLDGTEPAQSFPDVSVVLYAANGTRLDTIPVGDMSARGDAPERRTVEFSRPYRPVYVVIESPGFWQDDQSVPVEAFHWSEKLSAYEDYSVNDPDEKFSVD